MKEEGFADGGVAGLLGERPGYQTGGFLQLTPQNIAQAKSLTYPQAYQLDKTLGFKSNFPGGVGLGKYGLEGVKSVFGFGDQKNRRSNSTYKKGSFRCNGLCS